MATASLSTRKPYKGLPMEGVLAAWYARTTAGQADAFAADAKRIAARLADGAKVLEIAPGPGYLAVALARLGAYRITGLDISESFVRIARANAARAGLAIEFRQGDAARLPFSDASFDFVVCRAAFKNFADPHGAVCEMHRVLKPCGEALIIDLRSDVSDAELDQAVDGMKLHGVSDWMTRLVFKHSLRKRAYSRAEFESLAQSTPFGGADVKADLIGLDVWLKKPAVSSAG